MSAVAYAYTVSQGTEDLGHHEFSLLDVVRRSLCVPLKGYAIENSLKRVAESRFRAPKPCGPRLLSRGAVTSAFVKVRLLL